MDYDNKSCIISSKPSNFEPYALNVNSRGSARIARSSVSRQQSVVPKVEDYDGRDIKPSGRRLHARSAVSTTQTGRHQRKQRHRLTEEEKLAILNFPGYRGSQFDTPRYVQYREKARQKSRDKNSKEDVWPDRLENAFQLGELARDSYRLFYSVY